MPTTHQPANAVGIDVSHIQGDVDWSKVLTVGGQSFAFVKSTEGSHTPDNQFQTNWNEMGAVGITRGAYHFFRSNVDPNAQADFFLSKVTLIQSDMPAVMDLETVDGVSTATRIERAKVWLEKIEEATGKKPIIYTFPAFWHEQMDNTTFFSDSGYPLWIARFTHASSPNPLPGGWDKFTFWQFASGESGEVHVPGVLHGVDANRFNGTHEDLIQLFKLRG